MQTAPSPSLAASQKSEAFPPPPRSHRESRRGSKRRRGRGRGRTGGKTELSILHQLTTVLLLEGSLSHRLANFQKVLQDRPHSLCPPLKQVSRCCLGIISSLSQNMVRKSWRKCFQETWLLNHISNHSLIYLLLYILLSHSKFQVILLFCLLLI